VAAEYDTRRTILHVDMDAFYASVEQRDNPEYRGKPLVVGGTGNRGVVAAASYESRQYGIRSAMPMAEARRRCRHLQQVRPRFAVYAEVSRQVFSVFREFTPAVEGLSLDEAFLDVTASLKLFGSGRDIAARVKARILDTTDLTASVGVAGNKLVAKIASDLDKPDGLVVVTQANLRNTLDPLPAAVIPGIGRETLLRLRQQDIATVQDLREADTHVLERLFGRFAEKTRQRASGIDDRPVVPARQEKSISAEETYDSDIDDPEVLYARLQGLAERTAGRLRKAGLAAGTVQVKIRRADFTTYTRQKSVAHPVNGTEEIDTIARSLLGGWMAEQPGAAVRLLGVGGSQLAPAGQRDLFAGSEPTESVDSALDEIRERFPGLDVGRARSFKRN
jgi:DNA polymerase-4